MGDLIQFKPYKEARDQEIRVKYRYFIRDEFKVKYKAPEPPKIESTKTSAFILIVAIILTMFILIGVLLETLV